MDERVYWRCNSGHYFGSLYCPFDGWSSDELKQLSDAAEKIRTEGGASSIDALRRERVSEGALGRAIVVSLGANGRSLMPSPPITMSSTIRACSCIRLESIFTKPDL